MRLQWSIDELLPERAFRSLGGRLLTLEGGGGGKGKQPDAPDYTGAAQAQGTQSKENLAQQTWANRPTQITPWGRTDYTQNQAIDPGTGAPVTNWTQTESLTPEAQKALDAQLGIATGRSELAADQMGRTKDALANEFNWAGMPAAPGSMDQASGDAYKRMQGFQAPEREASAAALDAKLANMGLTIGSKAYETEKRRQSDEFARQDTQNLQASMGEGRAQGNYQTQLRQQAIAERSSKTRNVVE